MQKIGTGYTMYFNTSRERAGNLFVKPFRSKHVKDDEYLKRVTQYIHFNPIELIEPGWKVGKLEQPQNLMNRLGEYVYSSLLDFQNDNVRPERAVLDTDMIDILQEDSFNLQESLFEMAEYYNELAR